MVDVRPDGRVSACVLNRPTASIVQFNTKGTPRRRLPVCGDRPIRGGRVDQDGSGRLWLHHKSELGGKPLGTSGLYSLASDAVLRLLDSTDDDAMDAADLMIISSLVEFRSAELSAMLEARERRLLPPGDPSPSPSPSPSAEP